MAFTATEIVRHLAMAAQIRAQALMLIESHKRNPKAGSVFATQQRWLLAHVGFALHFRRDAADGMSGLRSVSGIDPEETGERVPTGVLSIADMASWLKLSRTHLTRKLREAEAMGSLGWQGRRGQSRMWVSREFRAEHAMAQAVKLAIIDDAFEGLLWTLSVK